jgi:hypothetical protein
MTDQSILVSNYSNKILVDIVNYELGFVIKEATASTFEPIGV